MSSRRKTVIAYLGGTSGDWGGASRVLFNTIRLLDRSRYEPIVLLPGDGPVVPTLDELGVRHVMWGPVREPQNGPAAYARDVWAAVRMLHGSAVDVLHVNFNHWRPAEVLAARLLRIPVVTHYHVVVSKPGPFVRLSALIISVSRFAASRSEPKTVRTEVVHNTVTLARFDGARDLRGDLGIPAGNVVITFVGQIRENKGVALFIAMAHAIAEANVTFLLVGECRDPARFEGAYTEERLRREIGGDARIRYLGYRSDIENVFRSSDAVVVPSRWGEPFGLINIEAGAAGKPVVATRDGGIPEVIRHGENGFLVDVDDLDALVAHVKRLVREPELRAALGRKARAIVEAEFTTRPVRRVEELYDELVGVSRPSSPPVAAPVNRSTASD